MFPNINFVALKLSILLSTFDFNFNKWRDIELDIL